MCGGLAEVWAGTEEMWWGVNSDFGLLDWVLDGKVGGSGIRSSGVTDNWGLKNNELFAKFYLII